MKVADKMTRDVQVVDVDDAVRAVASTMAATNVGAVPVIDGDRVVGMITDRDLVVRAVANSKGVDTKARDVMTTQLRYCFEDEDTEHVARNMAEQQVRRLPVMDRSKRLVGILSLDDLVSEPGSNQAVIALQGTSQPGANARQPTLAGTATARRLRDPHP